MDYEVLQRTKRAPNEEALEFLIKTKIRKKKLYVFPPLGDLLGPKLRPCSTTEKTLNVHANAHAQ